MALARGGNQGRLPAWSRENLPKEFFRQRCLLNTLETCATVGNFQVCTEPTVCPVGTYCVLPLTAAPSPDAAQPQSQVKTPVPKGGACLAPDIPPEPKACAGPKSYKVLLTFNKESVLQLVPCPKGTICQDVTGPEGVVGACVVPPQATACTDSEPMTKVAALQAWQQGTLPNADPSLKHGGAVTIALQNANGTTATQSVPDGCPKGVGLPYLSEQGCDAAGIAKEVMIDCQQLISSPGGKGTCVLNAQGLAYCQLDEPPPPDDDNDGVPNIFDNCVNNANPDQSDFNADGIGDACSPVPCVGAIGNTQLAIDPACFPAPWYVPKYWEYYFSLDDKVWPCLGLDEPETSEFPYNFDSDQDGRPNSEELAWQFDHYAFDGHFHPEHGETNPDDADTDDDGTNDGDEVAQGTCPLNANPYCHTDTCLPAVFPWSCAAQQVFAAPRDYSEEYLYISNVEWAAGSDVVLAVGKPNRLFRSVDAGDTWTLTPLPAITIPAGVTAAPFLWPALSLSADGQEVRTRLGKTIHVSHDAGLTWSQTEGFYDLNNGKWHTMAQYVSPDGTVEFASGYGRRLSMKKMGGDWQPLIKPTYWGIWSSYAATALAMSADGQQVIVEGDCCVVANNLVSPLPIKSLTVLYSGDLFPSSEPQLSMDGGIALRFDQYSFYGFTRVAHSLDAGHTWMPSPQDLPASAESLAMVANGSRAFVLTGSSTLWVSEPQSNASLGHAWQPTTLTTPLPQSFWTDISVSPDGTELMVVGFNDTDDLIYKVTCTP